MCVSRGEFEYAKRAKALGAAGVVVGKRVYADTDAVKDIFVSFVDVVFVAIGFSFLPEDVGVSERLEDGENVQYGNSMRRGAEACSGRLSSCNLSIPERIRYPLVVDRLCVAHRLARSLVIIELEHKEIKGLH